MIPDDWLPPQVEALLSLCAESNLAVYAAPREADGNCGLSVDIFEELVQSLLPDVRVREVHFVAPTRLRQERAVFGEAGIEVYAYCDAPHSWYLRGCRWSGHVVARIEDLLVDWTARQFNPLAPFPLVFRMTAGQQRAALARRPASPSRQAWMTVRG